VRRALLAGGFAAGASGLLTRKALADTPYTSFAYPLSSLPSMRRATATRTSLQRFADVCNVKDFGALGNNSHDDTAAIQAAINAASDRGGGTVYFPAGIYTITRRLEVATGPRFGSGTALTLLGCGANAGTSQGSMIRGNIRDYLLYVGHGNRSVGTIQGLCFNNSAEFPFTSTEPPGNPNNRPNFNGGDGLGAVYYGSGIGTSFINCDFQVSSGIGLNCRGFASAIIGCNFSGAFNGYNPPFDIYSSIGIVISGGNGAVRVSNCKIATLGHGICVFRSAGLMAEGIDLEVCGVGLGLGSQFIGFYDDDSGVYRPPWSWLSCNLINITGIIGESCFARFVEVNGCRGLVMENCHLASLAGNPEFGIAITGLTHGRFQNVQLTGAYSAYGIDICGTDGLVSDVIFENVYVANTNYSDEAHDWRLPPASAYEAGANPTAFINCSTDGAVTLSQLPATSPNVPRFMSGHPVLIKDSVDPLWTGTASNVGKPAVGGGTNKVFVRWNPRSAAWVLAG
jgi:hypothetical protein